ncbi:MAG: MFS transporter [Burkholderiaceae bacterium]|nr:MFS transporter [Burkholderiaceae bacterium]
MARVRAVGGGPYSLLVVALAAGIATVGATIFAISPLLADIAASFAIAPAQAGSLIGAYGLAMAVVAPAVGLFSRRVPRVWVIVAGLLLFAVVWLAAGAAQRFPVLLVLTLLAGAATGAVVPATYAYAGDLSSFSDRGRMMGRIVSGWSVAILLVVPLMALASQAIGWQRAFAGLAVAALLAALVLALAPRPAHKLSDQAEARLPVGPSLRRVLSHRPTLIVLAVNCIDMGAFYAVYAFIGSELRRVNDWGAAPAGLMIAAYGVGLLFVTLNGRLIDRIGKTRSAIGALCALCAVLGGLPWLLATPMWLVAGMVLWGFVQGAFFTAITALATEQIPGLRGVVTAMLSGSTYLGVTLFSPLAVTLYQGWGFAVVGYVSGLACLLAAAVLAWSGAQVAAVEASPGSNAAPSQSPTAS